LLFGKKEGLEGRVLENTPVGCFPAPPRRPQAGKSRFPHSKRAGLVPALLLCGNMIDESPCKREKIQMLCV
jgi:hypothetical protein